MKLFFLGIVLCLFSGLSLAQNSPTNMDSVSYALGVVLAKNLQKQGFKTINPDELAKGFAASLKDEEAIDPATANAKIQAHLEDAQAGEGREFLAENAKRPEVKVTDSGLQYEVLKEGNPEGKSPTATETVEVHYHGTLIDGTVFDSSVDRGQTIEFPLNRVIAGWTEGVQLMKEGAKYRFYIPYDLAYGPRGSAPKIPPYAALIFDVELFAVK